MFWTKFRVITLVPAFFVIILVSYFVSLLLKDKSEKVKLIPIQVITIILLVLEFFKQLFSIIRGYDNYHIPLHFCSLFLYFLPIAAFYKGKYKEHFRTIAAVVSACLFLYLAIYPDLIYGDGNIRRIPDMFKGDYTAFFDFHTVAFHNIALFPFFFFSFQNLCKHDTKRDIKAILIAFGIYAVVAATVANTAEINFNNFHSCNAPFLESVRLAMIESMGWFGQLIYVLIIAVGTLIIPLIAYFVLKLFEKMINDVKTGLVASIASTSATIIGLIIYIINASTGAFILSIVSMFATSLVLPTFINSIRGKQIKPLIITSALLVVNIVAFVLEYITLD